MEELHLGDCAAAIRTSESNVARLFKHYLNTSFTAYYNSVRINKATELLHSGCSVKETADMVGYSNLNYFYRTFKKQTGMTPREHQGGHETAFPPS